MDCDAALDLDLDRIISGTNSPEGPPTDRGPESLSHLLPTNLPPTAKERTLATHHLSKLDGELNQIRTRVSKVEQLLRNLQETERIAAANRTLHASILSPCRNLPPEIIAEILKHALLPSDYLLPYENHREDFKNLRAVCKQWREVAFATGQLWSFLCLVIPKADLSLKSWTKFLTHARADATFNSIKSYLERSGPALPLSLDFRCFDDGRIIETFGAFTDYLTSNPRWGGLSFWTTSHWLWYLQTKLKERFDAGEKPWRNLKTLVLRISQGRPYPTLPVPRPGQGGLVSSRFPKLQTLRVQALTLGEPLPFLTNVLSGGHPNIREITLSLYDPLDSYISLFAMFPRLQKLELHLPFAKRHAFTPASSGQEVVVTLPNLKAFHVYRVRSFSILSRFTLPALDTLSMTVPARSDRRTPHSIDPDHIAQLTDFLARSKCQLRTVDISCWFMDNAELLRLFQLLPHAQTLSVDHWFVRPEPECELDFWGILTRVRHLGLQKLGSPDRPISWDSFFTFVREKWSTFHHGDHEPRRNSDGDLSIVRIMRAILEQDPKIAPIVKEEIAKLEREGIEDVYLVDQM